MNIRYVGRRENAIMTDRFTGRNYEFAYGDVIEVSDECGANCLTQEGNWELASDTNNQGGES